MSFDWTTQEYCQKIGENKSMSLGECKEACRREVVCNAIVHDSKNMTCDVGSCSIPLISATWVPGAIRGYFLSGGTFNAIFL